MDFELTEEQQMLQRTVKKLAEDKFAKKAFTWEKSGEFPWENLKVLADNGLTGMVFPEEDGGQGSDLLSAILAMEQVAMVCPHTADLMQATNFGAIRQFGMYAQPELKKRVLPQLLKGEKMISVGMSEPNAGSASTDLRTTARIEGDEVVINGSKIFNTNGNRCSYFVVWVRFGDSVKTSGAVLVEETSPGFSRGKTEYHMSGEEHCMLYFDDCRVPVENILVRENGFAKLFPVFNYERAGNASRALALGQSAFDRAVAYTKERQQFGRPICEFQAIQHMVAEMKIKLDAARLLIYRAACNADKGIMNSLETSIAKCYANQVAFEVAVDSQQLFGGYGYSTEYPMEYLVRRTRGWMISGGTIQIQKNVIAQQVFDMKFDQRRPRVK